MAKRPEKTAEELMADLEMNPEFLRRRAEKQANFLRLQRQYEALDKPILKELATLGFPAQSVDDVSDRYAPLSDEIVGVLLRSLAACEDGRQCEMLVRAIATAKNRFDGRALTDCYDRIRDDESVRWIILHTIATTKPHSIDDWLVKAQNSSYIRKTLAEQGYWR
jgi:hypothetical protein